MIKHLRTLHDADLNGKLVLYRAPYDISLTEINGRLKLEDDSRIRCTLPTLHYLLQHNCRIVILTWVGRPNGKVTEELRTTPHAQALSALLGLPIARISDCIGPAVRQATESLQPGHLLMLENVRFYPEEESADEKFAKTLSSGYDLCVFDAFPQSHRIHASTTGIEKYLPTYAGLYLEAEYTHLSQILDNPPRPFTVIIGGAKVSDKVDAINNLLDIADHFLIGGAVANVFLKAKGYDLSNSYLEDNFVDATRKEKKDWVQLASAILKKADSKIHLPQDLIITDSLESPTKTHHSELFVHTPFYPWAAVDIGPKTQKSFAQIINTSKSIFWNGPLGLTSNPDFTSGSRSILHTVSQNSGTTIIAGGDTISLVNKYSQPDKFTYLSLAGGATLEFLAGKPLPALEPLLYI